MGKVEYNKRLFSRGIRGRYHTSRYRWVAGEISKLGLESPRIIELGCYDGKILDFLAQRPSHYLGLDANWEGGIDIGRKRWEDRPEVELIECLSPNDIPRQEPYDVGICMETFEHLDDELLVAYLEALRGLVTRRMYITVPVERGLLFLLKHGAKSLFRAKGKGTYTAADIWNLTLGKTDAVERDQHRGFDDRKLLALVSRFFKVEEVRGVFPGVPVRTWNLTLGIVASPKR